MKYNQHIFTLYLISQSSLYLYYILYFNFYAFFIHFNFILINFVLLFIINNNNQCPNITQI